MSTSLSRSMNIAKSLKKSVFITISLIEEPRRVFTKAFRQEIKQRKHLFPVSKPNPVSNTNFLLVFSFTYSFHANEA